MKKLNILVLLSVDFCLWFYICAEKNSGIPTQEQVQKLVVAAWKEPLKSIDIIFYKDYWRVPEPIEQIRKRVEEFVDRNSMAVHWMNLSPTKLKNAIKDRVKFTN